MVWIIISVFLVLGLLISGYSIKYFNQAKRYSLLLSLLIALIATFTGVLAAFELNKHLNELQEKEILVALLTQCRQEIIDDTHNIWKDVIAQCSLDFSTPSEVQSYLNHNPIHKPILITYLISNPLPPKYCSERYGLIIVTQKNLNKLQSIINESQYPINIRAISLYPYAYELMFLGDVLSAEIAYVEGSISINELDERYKEAYEEYRIEKLQEDIKDIMQQWADATNTTVISDNVTD